MKLLHIPWKPNVDWDVNVAKVLQYYDTKPNLKFGPHKAGKAIKLISDLCNRECATRTFLSNEHELQSADDIATILSNVTMAIQGTGNVKPPEDGGWYVTIADPYLYVVAPGFRKAWIGLTS